MAGMIVIDRDGVEHRIDGKAGVSIMESLREFEWGSAAICGGMCSCATCHIYVAPDWRERLPAIQPEERELLEELEGYRPDASRLSCQVPFEEALTGITITLAEDE